MKNLLALRMMASPEEYPVPLSRVSEIGVEGVEIFWPEGKSADEVRGMLEPHGLRVTSISCRGPLWEDEILDVFDAATRNAESVGAGVVFAALKRGDLPWEQTYERLRRFGQMAGDRGVRVALETHPDLCHNGDRALRTLTAVDSPHVGMNFDTANIHYYNRDASETVELDKVLGHVVSTHLKDTFGEFESSRFPVLGEGVVDFAAVIDMLNARGFSGPFTLELEGPIVGSRDPGEKERILEACVAYLREIGKV